MGIFEKEVIRIVSFTDAGERLAEKIRKELTGQIEPGECELFRPGRESRDRRSLSEWTREGFCQASALIFIGAAGIAVRAIAPFLKSKAEDPAVVVLDEKGQNVISLLSGHLGGANALARRIAGITGGNPVITTATDVNESFAVDTWAKEQGLRVINPEKIKVISSAVLRGESICFHSIYPILVRGHSLKSFIWNVGDDSIHSIPEREAGNRAETETCLIDEADKKTDIGIPTIWIDYRKTSGAAGSETINNNVIDQTLFFCPRSVFLGIGCKKGISKEQIGRVFESFLEDTGIFSESLAGVGSIDIKSEEAGLLSFCEAQGLPIEFFSAEELNELSGEFSASDFVKETTGVDCVSERSAVLAAVSARNRGMNTMRQRGKSLRDSDFIVEKKYAKDGVTFAAALVPKGLRL